MDEVIPGLWIGDLQSALNVQKLKSHNIFSILTAMRGRITIHETFIRHQILLDDTEDADVLIHLMPSIHFIQAELDKGRGVLVHCQAGISRSATIVAAYLMYSRNLDNEQALDMVSKVRPNIQPNQGFLRQLEIFHKANFKVSRRDKSIRTFYMERTVEEVMNSDSIPETEMFAKYPRTPTDSAPPTPGGPRRRIRCKMCRQELATREHMLDHGQLGPDTPASRTPAASRRPSESASNLIRPLTNQPRSRLGSTSETIERRPPLSQFGGMSDTLAMSTMESNAAKEETGDKERPKISPSSSAVNGLPTGRYSGSHPNPLSSLRSMPRNLDASLSMSAVDSEDDSDTVPSTTNGGQSHTLTQSPNEKNSYEAAKVLGRRLSDAVTFTLADIKDHPVTKEDVSETTRKPSVSVELTTSNLVNPQDLAAQLYANPKLAALRTSPTTTTTISYADISPPILVNPKCSGYFVEPMKWMEPFLESGQLAGKIVCPNKKCGTKLGNYDWAGVCCGCKEWVTPGFCISRSKVDEVV